jgi:hypothetical protein
MPNYVPHARSTIQDRHQKRIKLRTLTCTATKAPAEMPDVVI